MINKSFFVQFGRPQANESRFSKMMHYLVLFSPGIMLILLGLGFVFAPRLILTLLAIFFISLGALFFFALYRIIQFKRSLEKTAREFERNIRFQTVEVYADELEPEEETEKSKIILH